MTKLQDLINNKKKNYSFYTPDKYGRDFPRIPTGVYAVDRCIGGGIPIGVTNSFYGHPSSGKSSTATKTLASAQNLCWNCFEYLWDCSCGEQTKKQSVMVSTERFDLDWARNLGVNVDDLVIAEPDSGEEAVDIIYECLNTDDCGLIILDSLSRVIPEQEITDPALTNHVGIRAKLHAKLINKAKASLISQKKKNINSSFLATNQIRAKIGSFMGGEDVTGGFAVQHDFHLTCRMSQLKPEAEFMDAETGFPKYGKYKINITSPSVKKKVFTLAGTGEFYMAMMDTDYVPKGTILDYKTVMKEAQEWGLMNQNSGWSFKYDDLDFDKKADVIEFWRNHPEHFLSVKKKIIDHIVTIKKAED